MAFGGDRATSGRDLFAAVLAASLLFLATPSIAGRIPGGGDWRSDCYVEFDVQRAAHGDVPAADHHHRSGDDHHDGQHDDDRRAAADDHDHGGDHHDDGGFDDHDHRGDDHRDHRGLHHEHDGVDDDHHDAGAG